MAKRPPLIDHIGVTLVDVADAWCREYFGRMAEAGFPAVGAARGAILRHLGRDGVNQSDLPAKTGLTKQAVQQHLDVLEAEGLVTREPSPSDKRRLRIVYTDHGVEMFEIGNRIKSAIDAEWREAVGNDSKAIWEGLERLRQVVNKLDY